MAETDPFGTLLPNIQDDPFGVVLPESAAEQIPRAEAVEGEDRPGFLSRLIAPIPAIAEGLDPAAQDIRASLGAVEEAFGVPRRPKDMTVVESALSSAARSLIPLPSPDIAEGALRAFAPVSPVELAAEVLSGGLGLIGKMAVTSRIGTKAEKAIDLAAKVDSASPALTMEEASRRLAKIAEDAASANPKPVIEVVTNGGIETRSAEFIRAMSKVRNSVDPAKINLADPATEGLRTASRAQRAVADSTIEAIQKGTEIPRGKTEQISRAVANAVEDGTLSPVEAGRILGIQAADDPVRMANVIREMASESGRMLAQMSRIAREFSRVVGDNKEVLDVLKKGGLDKTDEWTAAGDAYKYGDNIRRGMMVAQWATFARNSVASTGRWALAIMEDAANQATGVMTGKIAPRTALSNVMENGTALVRLFSKKERDAIDSILKEFPIEAHRFSRTPVMDVSMDQKFVRWANYANNLQSAFFRRMAFDARIRQTMRMKGVSMADAPQVLQRADVEDALNHALLMDFAAHPEGKAGRAILKLYSDIPFLTAIGSPFPRFMLNAMRMVWDFSPAPLFTPSTYSKMASADPRIAFSAWNKSLIGTMGIATGMALDEMGLTGDRWYEVNTGRTLPDGKKEIVDTRPFAPFTFHLFLGRFMNRWLKNGDVEFLKLSNEDWVQGFAALRRTDIAGIPLADAMLRKDLGGFKERFIHITRDFLGSFTVGAGTFNDIVSAWDEENALPRSTLEGGVLTNAQRNIPFLSKDLPVRPAPFRAGPEGRAEPLIRQFTGLPLRQKTPAESEADSLNLRFPDIYPRTGNREFDRIIVEQMGPIAEQMLQSLIAAPEYQALDPETTSGFNKRRELFKGFVNEARSAGKKIASAKRPDLAFDEYVRRSSAFVREELEKVRDELLKDGSKN